MAQSTLVIPLSLVAMRAHLTKRLEILVAALIATPVMSPSTTPTRATRTAAGMGNGAPSHSVFVTTTIALPRLVFPPVTTTSGEASAALMVPKRTFGVRDASLTASGLPVVRRVPCNQTTAVNNHGMSLTGMPPPVHTMDT